MGGSGGGRWNGGSGQSFKLSDQQTETKIAKYSADVNQALSELLAQFNDRDVEKIRGHLDEIHAAISNDSADTIDLLLGGSVSKHTYVDGLSDIDVLARLKNKSYQNLTPAEVLKEFGSVLANTIKTAKVSVGDMAVTINFNSGHEIQVLPAIETATGFKIPSSTTENWSRVIKPDAFAAKITEMNSILGQKLVPTIKLFKSLVTNNLSLNQKFSGYHAESLAIEAFKGYSGPQDYKSMLSHLCTKASSLVLNPIKDRTGQSVHVDDYLGANGSPDRQQLSSTVSRVSNRLKAADASMNADAFKGAFE